MQHRAYPLLLATVTDLPGRETVVLDPGQFPVIGPFEALRHVDAQRRLAVLDGQQIVGPATRICLAISFWQAMASKNA